MKLDEEFFICVNKCGSPYFPYQRGIFSAHSFGSDDSKGFEWV
jgi:hypothetical protein